MKTIVRPTTLGLAFLNAALTTCKQHKEVDHQHAAHNPSIPWPARRVMLNDSRVGLVSEPSIKLPRRM